MERLKQMKDRLVNCVETQMSCLENASADELGAAVDMIKDLDEAIYYCAKTKAIEDQTYGQDMYHYHEKSRPIALPYGYAEMSYTPYEPPYYEKSKHEGFGPSAYYFQQSPGGGGGNQGSSSYSYSGQEGRSGSRRRMYMEGKEMHRDKGKQMQELEAYVQELGSDLAEMVQDASPEEKQLLQQKISVLANKIK